MKGISSLGVLSPNPPRHSLRQMPPIGVRTFVRIQLYFSFLAQIVRSALRFRPGRIEILYKQATVCTLHTLQFCFDNTQMPVSTSPAFVGREFMSIIHFSLPGSQSCSSLTMILSQILSVTSLAGRASHGICFKRRKYAVQQRYNIMDGAGPKPFARRQVDFIIESLL